MKILKRNRTHKVIDQGDGYIFIYFKSQHSMQASLVAMDYKSKGYKIVETSSVSTGKSFIQMKK